MPKRARKSRRQPEQPPLLTLADKLDFLFRQVHGRARGEFSYREVTGGIEQAGGPKMSPTYLMYLRKGDRSNPSMQHIAAIANFFGVPATYFLDDEITNRVAEEIDMIAALRDPGVRSAALRLADLSREGLAAAKQAVEQIHREEVRHAKLGNKGTRS